MKKTKLKKRVHRIGRNEIWKYLMTQERTLRDFSLLCGKMNNDYIGAFKADTAAHTIGIILAFMRGDKISVYEELFKECD